MKVNFDLNANKYLLEDNQENFLAPGTKTEFDAWTKERMCDSWGTKLLSLCTMRFEINLFDSYSDTDVD